MKLLRAPLSVVIAGSVGLQFIGDVYQGPADAKQDVPPLKLAVAPVGDTGMLVINSISGAEYVMPRLPRRPPTAE